MDSIPDGWLDSFEAIAVTLTIAAVFTANMMMVLGIIVRRSAKSLANSYVEGRERHYSGPVLRALIEPPDRVAIRQVASRGRVGVTRAGNGVIRTLHPSQRPGDRKIVERMFLQMAVELRGIDRATITGICEDAGFVERYQRRLRSHRWWVRLAAAQRLGIIRSARATTSLSHALHDPHREVSLAALRALGEIGDPRSYDRLLAAMEDETRWDSVLIAEVVLELGAPVAGPILTHMQLTRDTALQAGYARLLGLLREPSAVASLAPLLDGTPQPVRLETMRALGAIGDSRVMERLVPYLEDSDPSIRAATAEALGRIGGRDTVECLRPLLADTNRRVRCNAAGALAAFGPAGLQALDMASADPDPVVRGVARQVLAEVAMGLR